MSDSEPQPDAARPIGPTTYDEIKPMRLSKAIRIMHNRVVWLEGRIERDIADGKPGIGHFLREMAAIKALIAVAEERIR